MRRVIRSICLGGTLIRLPCKLNAGRLERGRVVGARGDDLIEHGGAVVVVGLNAQQ